MDVRNQQITRILDFAGCWHDLSDQEFNDYLSRLIASRQPPLSDQEFKQLLQVIPINRETDTR
ncbi:MAG: hypothetical protein AAGF26_07305 [Cyanobacteria bacterium P01_G01_bin.49]